MNARVVDAFKTCNFQQKFLVVSGWIDIFLVLVIPALSHVLTIHTIAQPLSYFLQTISKANTRFHCQITPSGSEHETLYERQHERLSPRCPNLQGHACVCVCVCVLEEKRRIRCRRLVPSRLHCAHSLTHSLTHCTQFGFPESSDQASLHLRAYALGAFVAEESRVCCCRM